VITRIAGLARTWRVPAAAELAAMSDEQAAALWSATRRKRARAEIEVEMSRRDQAAERARRVAERKERQRERRRAERAEYDLYVHAAWLAAEAACNGYLLSKAGLEKGIDPVKLWPMWEERAIRLASEELRGWWAANGRITFAEWQRQAREQRPETAVTA
jgi:hypothetical protein